MRSRFSNQQKPRPSAITHPLAKSLRTICLAITALAATFATAPAEAQADQALYEGACAACHGDDGKGRSQSDLAFETPVPDFSDCEFASREPDADWATIISEGGPVRGFDQMMPAFGDALSQEEIYAILRHIRSFCPSDSWPRGEFNLPRTLFTEKAFVEDEAVLTTAIDRGDSRAVTSELLYEKRFGSRSMIEVAVPFGLRNVSATSDRRFGLGDVSIGYKYAAFHNLEKRSILSVGLETILPTGNEAEGFGKGTTIIEPFVAYGWLMTSDAFLQAHLFAEFPTSGDSTDEAGFRLALGKTWTEGKHGRAWTPMIEALFARDFVSGAHTSLDLVPQVQLSLNTRQHVLLNVGARIPTTHTSGRDVRYVFYLLWDWFDGGLADGW